MTPTIYVITHHRFNHEGPERYPLDARFLNRERNYTFYVIDKERPPVLKGQKVLFEHEIDKSLHRAGAEFFAEWSFLLAEAKHAFCTYPLFMLSSRFYEKNRWLYRNLNEEWPQLFNYFDTYRWGYLPSYDRNLKWINLKNYHFFPLQRKAIELASQIFTVQIPREYSYLSDFFCNYIGFRSREDLLEYVGFYSPLLETLFDSQYQFKGILSDYVRPTGHYRNEKPFTFYLEFLSHLFFFKSKAKFFGLHYDGYYEVDEACKKMLSILPFPIPLKSRLDRYLRSNWRNIKKYMEAKAVPFLRNNFS